MAVFIVIEQRRDEFFVCVVLNFTDVIKCKTMQRLNICTNYERLSAHVVFRVSYLKRRVDDTPSTVIFSQKFSFS